MALGIGLLSGPTGGGVSYERGTPVAPTVVQPRVPVSIWGLNPSSLLLSSLELSDTQVYEP